MVLLSTSVWRRCLQAGASPLGPFSRVAAPGRRGTSDTAPERFLLSRARPSLSLAKSPFSNRLRLPGLFPRALRRTGSSPHSSCAPRRSPGAWTPMRSESSRLDSTGSVIGSTGSGPSHDSRSRSSATGWSGLSGGSCVEGRRLDGKRLGVAREEDKPPVGLCRSGGPESHLPATEALMGIARESPGERTFRGRSPSRRKQLRVAVRFVTAAPRTDSQNQPAALRCSLCSAACCVTGYRTPRFTVQFPSLRIDLVGLKRATSQNRRCSRSAQRKRPPRRPAAPPGDPVLPPGSSRTTGHSGVSMEWAPPGRAAHGRMSIRGATRLREQPELRSVTAGSVSPSL